ncbi:plasmid replication, integration and excision activator [Embleya sp. NBC_00888]|uniref:plasmid replication, integration and excision activator n=1 Tax=Embleya sp. NBC_00888 TaxID=2975960 RepID=UPI00386AF9C8|nr:plasmid replication, integration and excision activator [Embleya sp. NBC_00888]
MAIKGAIPVSFAAVFPFGAFAKSVVPMADFEASKGGVKVQARDKTTGLPVWAVSVVDGDPDANEATVKVKVASDAEPVLPDALPGLPFRPVEFEGLTVTAYVNQSNNRVAFSYRASGLRAPGGPLKSAIKTAA